MFISAIQCYLKRMWCFRNSKVGALPDHKFEIDSELEGRAEEVCVESNRLQVADCIGTSHLFVMYLITGVYTEVKY